VDYGLYATPTLQNRPALLVTGCVLTGKGVTSAGRRLDLFGPPTRSGLIKQWARWAASAWIPSPLSQRIERYGSDQNPLYLLSVAREGDAIGQFAPAIALASFAQQLVVMAELRRQTPRRAGQNLRGR